MRLKPPLTDGAQALELETGVWRLQVAFVAPKFVLRIRNVTSTTLFIGIGPTPTLATAVSGRISVVTGHCDNVPSSSPLETRTFRFMKRE